MDDWNRNRGSTDVGKRKYKGDEGKGTEKERNGAGVKVMSGFKITQQVVG